MLHRLRKIDFREKDTRDRQNVYRSCAEQTHARGAIDILKVFFVCFSVKLYSELLHRFTVFAPTLSLLCRITGTRTRSLPVRNAASFILPVPYVSDFSITAARYFTDNLRVANGVHNEAEMAWYSDGPRICLHSVPSPSSFFWSPNTRLSLPSSPIFLLPASGEKTRSTTSTLRSPLNWLLCIINFVRLPGC